MGQSAGSPRRASPSSAFAAHPPSPVPVAIPVPHTWQAGQPRAKSQVLSATSGNNQPEYFGQGMHFALFVLIPLPLPAFISCPRMAHAHTSPAAALRI
ncbi:hypothetical protein MVEN_00025800 [Mycena venus]|uniref:Uncharacterized protein n=1 Tax=Mycena venus TaxID=2733690 RepID=A0A8H7DER6_9AGAR|nr:hypothetical protein MVEN_00025800 [Mycena venus]